MAAAIEMPFASRTRVGPGKHLLHKADRLEANILLCLFNTIQPSSFELLLRCRTRESVDIARWMD